MEEESHPKSRSQDWLRCPIFFLSIFSVYFAKSAKSNFSFDIWLLLMAIFVLIGGLLLGDRIRSMPENIANQTTAVALSGITFTAILGFAHVLGLALENKGTKNLKPTIELLTLFSAILVSITVSAVSNSMSDQQTKISVNASTTALFTVGTLISEMAGVYFFAPSLMNKWFLVIILLIFASWKILKRQRRPQ